MNARWLFLPVCCALGCSPAPAAPPTTPASVDTPPASAPAATPGGWTAVDPRAVRCGIDDGPRNVVGFRADPGADSGSDPGVALPRGLLAAQPRARPMQRIDMAMPEVEPTPLAYIERLPPQFVAGPVQAGLADTLKGINPSYEVCNAMLTEPVAPAQVSFDLELGVSGAPLRVEPTADGAIGPFQRCLMERVCQIQPRVALAQPTRVRIPLKLSPTPPNQPPAPSVPQEAEVPVDAVSEGKSASSVTTVQLRAAAAETARRCGAVAGRARVRFLVDLRVTTTSSGRRGVRSLAAVSQLRTQILEGAVPTSVLGCVVGSIQGRIFAGDNGPATRTEAMILTWNP